MKNLEQQRHELGLKCAALISDLHYFNNLDFYIELTKKFLNYKIFGLSKIMYLRQTHY